MAEMNAEMAFLQSMQAGEAGAYDEYPQQEENPPDDDGEDEEEDYDPSNLIPETHYSPQAQPAPAVQSPVSATSTQGPSRTDSRASASKLADAAKSAKQPRTMGGFVVDDEDDEDEVVMTRPKAVGSNGLLNVARGSSHTPLRSLSQTPSNTLSPDVSIQKAAQVQGFSGVASSAPTDTAPNLAAVIPDTGASSAKGIAVKPSQTLPAPQANAATAATTAPSAILPKARLPNDRIGMLEDRIAEDLRGDMDAWLSLISEYRKRNKFEEARTVYDRFFKVFPSAAEQWVAYANMELENNDFYRVEQIFSRSLMSIPNVQLWSTYLDYVRRRNNLTTDTSGNARQIVSQSYDFVLQHIGIDKDSGQIWQDYVHFIKTGPGNLGGSGWQDQQKMDLLRKTYQCAVCVPTQAVTALWKEYDAFEMGLNKMTGRKFLQEKSPAYMTARGAKIALDNLTKELDRTTLPRLPPALGFEGDVEYMKQVEIWKKWAEWEKEDPLVLKDEDPEAYKARVVYVYKQAVMALRFWPEMWYEAAEFCFENGLDTEGDEFLSQGVAANPESCLLAFKRADRYEVSTANEEGEESSKRRGDAIWEIYDKLTGSLHDLITQTTKREAQTIARLEEAFAQQAQSSPTGSKDEDEEEDQGEAGAGNAKETMHEAQVEAVKKGSAAQIELLRKTLSHAWIALMRAIRRIQGKGQVGENGYGSRQVLAVARKKGRLLGDVYVAAALMEWNCYKDVAATKLFERAMKLFPDDERLTLEYLKHLIATNDITNARAVFETSVSRLAQKPETRHKAKPLYAYFHEYESHYGELSQVIKLEKRMGDFFPEDPQLSRFTHRFVVPGFDPTAIRPIISPATQARPKQPPLPTIEKPPSMQNSPRPLPVQITNSPKRPFMLDESDSEAAQPRKIARGESPLKGAAGRRLDALQKRNQQNIRNDPHASQATPAPLPRDIVFLLSIIPRADTYKATIFSPQKMVDLLRNTDLTRHPAAQGAVQLQIPLSGYGQPSSAYPYVR